MGKKNQEFEMEMDENFSDEILKSLGIQLPETDDLTAVMLEYIEKIGNRKVYLFGDVTTENILAVIYQIHILEKKDQKKDIELIINSNGGYVVDCLALVDVMDSSPCDIKILVLGVAASAACLIASNGTPGKRFAGKNAEFMFHEVSQMIPDTKTSDMNYHKKGLERTQKRFNKIFASNTQKTVKQIKEDFYTSRQDRYMTSYEARRFGIIDHVYGKKKSKQ